MTITLVTSRSDEEALMAVASAEYSAGTHAPSSGARSRDGRFDWFGTPADALRFLQGARRYAASAHDADFDLPRKGPSPAQLARLRQVRDAVRALIDGDRRGYERRSRALLGAYAFRIEPDGDLRPAHGGWDAFIAERLPTLVAIGAHAERLRRCANPECGWAVWDSTRSNTRVWCDSRTCGNKMKVRAFRARKRREGHTRRA